MVADQEGCRLELIIVAGTANGDRPIESAGTGNDGSSRLGVVPAASIVSRSAEMTGTVIVAFQQRQQDLAMVVVAGQEK